MSKGANPISSRRVAVIGAGAAGLVAARELRRESHSVVVFERQKQVGGLWVYTPLAESDPVSLDPARSIVHSSVYSSLRTNLPRECMGFSDFPFVPRPGDESRDPRRYPSHREVLMYLQDFAREYKIEEMIRFETEVVRVEPAAEDGRKWRVQSVSSGCLTDEFFDAVVVCNGHFTEPRLAHIPDSWPGKQIHSHNYRVPGPFKDQVVVVIGNYASGADISRDIASVAKEVHIASRTIASEIFEKLPGLTNLWLNSMIESTHEDGSVVFQNGKVVYADTIVHCTGYKYFFPFLDTNGYVNIDDNRVGPIYKHVFPPALAPGLSFIGIPFNALQCFMFEIQSKWVAAVLSGRVMLLTRDKMMEDVVAFYEKVEAKRYTHRLRDQVEYFNWITEQCGCLPVERWREQEHSLGDDRIFTQCDTYRDQWDDDHLIAEAYEDFAKLIQNGVC
ncbi:unnamed protein product [Microthlaspi erraticum]|uniref:Flavin-containing monooxygenase n=1 Tax=Microthlaspi erraticum TaxID=1685480 RepID=A0A6D2J7R9_9BRAS|nr:unnamed protein product [Microthlaspi erraticum]